MRQLNLTIIFKEFALILLMSVFILAIHLLLLVDDDSIKMVYVMGFRESDPLNDPETIFMINFFGLSKVANTTLVILLPFMMGTLTRYLLQHHLSTTSLLAALTPHVFAANASMIRHLVRHGTPLN